MLMFAPLPQLGMDVASRAPVYVFSAIILVWYIVQVMRDIILACGKGLQKVRHYIQLCYTVVRGILDDANL